jgi:hypothetical protein
MPRHWGLWAAGLIVYKHKMPVLASSWMHEIQRWTIQDQVSHPYVAWLTGDRPESLPHHLLDNPWLKLHTHLDGTG